MAGHAFVERGLGGRDVLRQRGRGGGRESDDDQDAQIQLFHDAPFVGSMRRAAVPPALFFRSALAYEIHLDAPNAQSPILGLRFVSTIKLNFMRRFGNSFWTVRMISLVVLAFFSSVGLVRYTAEPALRNG